MAEYTKGDATSPSTHLGLRDELAVVKLTESGKGYVQELGGNDSAPSYQTAEGAPVEAISPLGLNVTSFTAVFLNIGQMIGTGVFSTRMLKSCLSSFPLQPIDCQSSCYNFARCRLCWAESGFLGPWISHSVSTIRSLRRAC